MNDICTYENYLKINCAFPELTKEESYYKIKEELIKILPENYENIIIKSDDDFALQITNILNELSLIKNKNLN